MAPMTKSILPVYKGNAVGRADLDHLEFHPNIFATSVA